MIVTFKKPTAHEFNALRIKSGIVSGAKSEKNAEIALANSLFIVSIRDDDTLIGFGRVVGDGAITFAVTDIMVDKAYHRQGIGRKIMQEMDAYFEKNTDKDAYIILVADKPADRLYTHFQFKNVEPKSSGMIRRK